MIWSAFCRSAAVALLAVPALSGCTDEAATEGPGGLLATIAVGEETFHVSCP